MRETAWLVISRNGIRSVRKKRPALGWDEIAVRLNVEIPNALFDRPTVEVRLKVDGVPNTAYDSDLIINAVEQVAQQSGAKIVFSVQEVCPEGEEGSRP